jgi:diguanylate cyclase (GGDEF)-like protein
MRHLSLRDDVSAQLCSGSLAPLSPGLAKLCEERQGPARKRHLAAALGLTAAAVIVAAVLDLHGSSAQFAHHLMARACVIALCAIGVLGVIGLRPGVWESAAFGAPLVGQAILSAWIGSASPPDMVDRSIVMFLMLFAVLCAVPPLRAPAPRVLAVTWFTCFTLTLALVQGPTRLPHHLLALAGGALALMVGVRLSARREAGRRREFLQTLYAELTASELARTNGELERLMNTDVLTGVANRRRFESDMNAVWQARVNQGDECSLGLLLADVDHFKLFNDRAGHAEGDACLRAVANAISLVAKDAGLTVARWGGEEFAILAAGLASPALLALAERMRQSVESLSIPHPAMPGHVVTVSIGGRWSGPGAPCENPERLLRDADMALYAAKSGGRNRVMLDSAMETQRCAA